MLPLDVLKTFQRCIVHGNCPDGRASALIIHAALPGLPIAEMSYGTPEHRALEPGPVLFCDFSPFVPPKSNPPTAAELAARRAVLLKWAEAGAAILDHHDPELVEPFGAMGVFGENSKGESGAALALREVLAPIKGPERGFVGDGRWRDAVDLARLSAIRDTWRRDSTCWDTACSLAEVLRFLPLSECLERGIGGMTDLHANIGPTLLDKKRDAAAEAAKNAVRLEAQRRKVAVIPSVSLTSDVSDVLPEADIVAGFDYAQEDGGNRIRLIVSLRGRKGVDVRVIAQRHGGGGHVAAAGFSLPVNAGTTLNPYYVIATALES